MKPSSQAALADARQRGATSLAELFELAAGSPVDSNEAAELARAVGIQLGDAEGDPWEHIERFADEGPDAYRETREGPAPAEELAVGDPATVPGGRAVAGSPVP